MSKAIEGAALLAGAIGATILSAGGASVTLVGAMAFFEGSALGATIAAVGLAGVAMEAGAIADALTANRGMNITTRQPAAARQIIYGQQRVGGVNVYQSTTGSKKDQYNYVIVVAGHKCSGIQALYLDGRKVWFDTSTVLTYPIAQNAPTQYSIQPDGVGFGGPANGNTYAGPDGTHYNFGGEVFAQQYLGDQDASRWCGSLQANDSNWEPTSAGTPYLGGCTFLYVKCEYNTTLFQSAPEIRVTVDGKPVYDPRTGTTAFSANSALVIADWLQDTVYGLGMAVNQAQLIAAANVCDEQVPLAAGGTESRYQCHYHFDTSTAPSDALGAMLKSCGGRISVIGGEVYIWPAYWQGPSANFDEGVLTAPVQWDPTAAYKDNCNYVTGTFVAPNYPYNVAGNAYDSNGFDSSGVIQNNFQFGFQPTSFPPYAQDPLHGYASDQWRNEDSGVSGAWSSGTTYAAGAVVGYTTNITVGTASVPYYSIYKSLASGNVGNVPSATSTHWQLAGVNLPLEVNYNMVLSIAQAQRLAKIDLLRRRFWGRGQLEMGLSALAMQEMDVMYFTFPLHGWLDKVLEITGCTVKVSGQDGSPGAPGKPPEIRVLFDVAETDPSVYEWSDVEELSIYDVPQISMAPRVPTAPTGLTLTSSAATALTALDGTVTPRIEVSWTTPLDGLVTGIQVQYQQVGTTAWLDGGTVSVDTNLTFLSPVIAGQQYSVQIRSVRASGAVSVWEGPVTITAGLVLSIVTQSGFGIGSLVASAYTDGTASIECNPFTAYIGQLSLGIFPAGPVTLTVDGTMGGSSAAIAQQTLYYVYYVDPNCAGGNVTPIATTSISDFVGKAGYFLIDSIVTPYAGSGGGSPTTRYAPSNASDSGTRTTSTPYAAYDGNLSTSAGVSGVCSSNYSAGAGTDTTSASGICTFAGFPNYTAPSAMTLSVVLSVQMLKSPSADTAISLGTVTITPSIGGTAGTPTVLSATTASTTYTFPVASGTNLSTVSLKIDAEPGSATATPTYRICTSSASALVEEIYIS